MQRYLLSADGIDTVTIFKLRDETAQLKIRHMSACRKFFVTLLYENSFYKQGKYPQRGVAKAALAASWIKMSNEYMSHIEKIKTGMSLAIFGFVFLGSHQAAKARAGY